MFRSGNLSKALLLLLVMLVLALPACSAATPTQAIEPPTQEAIPSATVENTATSIPPTATSAPTATELPPTPTMTAVPPTPTATAVPPDQQVISWCLPKDTGQFIKVGDDPAVIPEGARAGKLANGVIDVATPDLSCTFVFNLGQPIKDGTMMEILDVNNSTWLKALVSPSPKDPNVGVAVLTHPYITEPPFWTVIYGVVVKAADGSALWTGKMNVHNFWMPAKCWDGTMPNFKTLYCKKNQDLHPWDPAYTPPPPAK